LIYRFCARLALVGSIVLCAPAAWALPTFAQVRDGFLPSDTLILSREGEVAAPAHRCHGAARAVGAAGRCVAALRQALVLSEDKRFFEHSGVDWRAASAAAWGNLWNQRTRGASTITMQLAGLLDGDWRQGPGGRTVVQKLGQTVAAQVLDRRWRKDQILEAYLNLVPFRSELVGIDALSRTLFGKAAHGLDDREAAVAAALVRAPNARPALVAQRACGVLRDMQPAQHQPVAAACQGGRHRRRGPVDCDALEFFTTAALQRRAFDASEGVAPHFARHLLRQRFKDGVVPPSACPARCARRCSALPCRACSSTCASCVAAMSKTAPCWCWTTPRARCWPGWGLRGQLSQASEVDGVLALRQPGSTLKPFLYAQAIAEQRLTAASLVHDSPAQITTASGLYIPQNYDRQFKGWVSVRTALAASLNVPACARWSWSRPMRFIASWLPWACRCAKAATTLATAWRWAAPRCRCCT
jgi:Membrane carboxypeptidase/penicillin-binding protein PbpC